MVKMGHAFVQAQAQACLALPCLALLSCSALLAFYLSIGAAAGETRAHSMDAR